MGLAADSFLDWYFPLVSYQSHHEDAASFQGYLVYAIEIAAAGLRLDLNRSLGLHVALFTVLHTDDILPSMGGTIRVCRPRQKGISSRSARVFWQLIPLAGILFF